MNTYSYLLLLSLVSRQPERAKVSSAAAAASQSRATAEQSALAKVCRSFIHSFSQSVSLLFLELAVVEDIKTAVPNLNSRTFR